MPGTGKIAFEIVPAPKFRMMSRAASAPWPEAIMSCHLRPCGSAMIAGSPPKMSGKKPMPSEWSATTRKSSGRDSLTGWPEFDRDLLPARELERVGRGEPGAEGTRVEGERRVQVRVAEERAGGVVPARVGGVGRLAREGLGEGGRVGLPGVLGEGHEPGRPRARARRDSGRHQRDDALLASKRMGGLRVPRHGSPATAKRHTRNARAKLARMAMGKTTAAPSVHPLEEVRVPASARARWPRGPSRGPGTRARRTR